MDNCQLEVKIDELETRIANAKAFIEIMNLQSRFNYYLEANYTDQMVDELFAHKNPEVSCEICDSGIYRGIESIKKFWDARHDIQAQRGYLGTVMLKTPHIRVSDDGKKAIGTWHAFGPNSLYAMPYPCDQEKLTATWFMGKYYNEYVLEDGKWMILSMKLIYHFFSPQEQGWIKQSDAYRVAPPPSVCKPDVPSYWSYMYHPHGDIDEFMGKIPEPY